MSIEFNQRLAAKVRAQNAANAYAVELYPKLVDIFAPLVNQKILKVDGTLLAKIIAKIPTLNTPNLTVYRNSGSKYTLSYLVKASEPETDRTCCYANATLYIGDMDNGILTKLYPSPNLRTDFNALEITQKREEYRKAKAAADVALVALIPFGEHDNF